MTDPKQLGDQAAFLGPYIPNIDLTKREYFAALALPGIMFWDATVNEPSETGKLEDLARQAVNMADALLAVLAKEPK